MAVAIKSPQALRDVDEIWNYIARDSITAAHRLVDHFDNALNMLAESPGVGRKREELSHGIRSYIVGKYLLFYRTIPGGIELVRVIHGARDLPRLFEAK